MLFLPARVRIASSVTLSEIVKIVFAKRLVIGWINFAFIVIVLIMTTLLTHWRFLSVPI